MVSPPKPAGEPGTMSLLELAQELGISVTTAYERAARDDLPVPKIPGLGRYRYSRRLVERLLEGQPLNGGGGDSAKVA